MLKLIDSQAFGLVHSATSDWFDYGYNAYKDKCYHQFADRLKRQKSGQLFSQLPALNWEKRN